MPSNAMILVTNLIPGKNKALQPCKTPSRISVFDRQEHSEVVVCDVTKPDTLTRQLGGVTFVVCCLGSPLVVRIMTARIRTCIYIVNIR
eukprot:scaffold51698_cov20-Prasinocladus_malaysianus.AAC.1